MFSVPMYRATYGLHDVDKPLVRLSQRQRNFHLELDFLRENADHLSEVSVEEFEDLDKLEKKKKKNLGRKQHRSQEEQRLGSKEDDDDDDEGEDEEEEVISEEDDDDKSGGPHGCTDQPISSVFDNFVKVNIIVVRSLVPCRSHCLC